MTPAKGRLFEIVGVVAAFAAPTAVIMVLQGSGARSFYFLFIVPVALAAGRLGITAGVVMSLVAIGTIALHAHAAGVAIGPLEYVLRAATFMAITLLARSARTEAVHDEPASNSAEQHLPRRLTPRELEVLRLLALGHTNAEIADTLYLSVRTVESHRARLQRKLMRRGRSELTRYALKVGLIDPSDPAGAEEERRPQQAPRSTGPGPRGGTLGGTTGAAESSLGYLARAARTMPSEQLGNRFRRDP